METFLAIGFGLLAAFFAWRYAVLSRGLGKLAAIFNDHASPPTLADLPNGVSWQPSLAALNRAVLDLTAEVTLDRDSEVIQRRFLEALLNAIEDSIFVLDENLEIRFSNRAAGLLFSSDQTHVGRSLIQVCLDHRVVDAVELAIEIGGKTQEQFQRRSDADADERAERIYLIEAEPLSALGSGRGAWVVIRDITLQLETEQIRQDFVANASHELRTPLSIINGYLEMLDSEEDPPDEETARRCIQTMRKHSERISRTVEDMLTISKLESETPEALNRNLFDIGDCIEGIIEHLQPLIEANDTKVKIVLPEDKRERELFGDRFYWDQVFFNLIENALKQNPNSGLKLKITVISENGRFQIDISDNGIGIPAAAVPHIFKRFYRVQLDHSKTVKGTGLGLSIVKRAIEAHHGTICVRSRPGRETTFTIFVPKPGELNH